MVEAVLELSSSATTTTTFFVEGLPVSCVTMTRGAVGAGVYGGGCSTSCPI